MLNIEIDGKQVEVEHGTTIIDAADKLGVPFLGEVPLHMAIRETSDAGRPVVATEPDGPHAKTYREIAARVRDKLGAKGGARAAPKIVIEA